MVAMRHGQTLLSLSLLLSLGLLAMPAHAARNTSKSPAAGRAKEAAGARVIKRPSVVFRPTKRTFRARTIDPNRYFLAGILRREGFDGAPVYNLLVPRDGKGAPLIQRTRGFNPPTYSSIRLTGRKFRAGSIDPTAYFRITVKQPGPSDTFGLDVLIPKAGRGKLYLEQTGGLAAITRLSELEI